MSKILNEYYKKCTTEGIIKHSDSLGIFIQKLYLYVFIIMNLILILVLYIILFHYMDYYDIVADMHFFGWIKYVFTLGICVSLMVIISSQTALRVHHSLALRIVKKRYSDLLRKHKLVFHQRRSLKEKFLYPFYSDNEFYMTMNIIKKVNILEFEKNNHIDQHHGELINELIAINNNQICQLNDKSLKRSNKVIYGFICGIIINKLLEFIYTILLQTDYSQVALSDVGFVISFMLISIIIVSVISNKIYSWTYINLWSNENTKQIRRVEDFNEYLIQKKIDILQDKK